MKHKAQGFTLIAAVFILVILSLLSAFIIGIAATTRSTATGAIKGADAYFAAVSGLEWGINQTLSLVACPPTTTLNINQGSIKGFSVTVSCTSNSFVENPLNITVHTITSRSEFGTFGNSNYASREMKITIISGL